MLCQAQVEIPIRLCPENISAHAVRTRSWKRRKDGTNQPPDDPGNPTANFHGEKRSNHTHESTTDSDALLARKGSGKEAKLSYNGNLLTENRNGLIVSTEVFPANGLGERAAATAMLEKIPGDHRVTVGVDKG